MIDQGCVRIRSQAFQYCTRLLNVWLPDSIQSIDCCAFAGCRSLKTVGRLAARRTCTAPRHTHRPHRGRGTCICHSHTRECRTAAVERDYTHGVWQSGVRLGGGQAVLACARATTVLGLRQHDQCRARAMCSHGAHLAPCPAPGPVPYFGDRGHARVHVRRSYPSRRTLRACTPWRLRAVALR